MRFHAWRFTRLIAIIFCFGITAVAQTPSDFKPVKVVLWGTSSFHGGKNPDQPGTFCGRLQERIFPHQLINLSVGGATLPFYEEQKTVDAILDMQPDVVFVMQGSNDIGSGRDLDDTYTAIEEAEARFDKKGIRTVFSTWQPRRDFDEIRQTRLLTLNQWLRNRYASFNRLLDVPPTLTDPDNPLQINPKYDSGDGVHFGDAGNQAWSEQIDLPVIFNFPTVSNSFDGLTGFVVEETSAQTQGAWTKTDVWGHHGGTALLSGESGAAAEFSYTGRNFCVWSKRRNDFGIVEILLDGKLLAEVDTYGVHWPKDDGYRATPIYSSAYVPSGRHTVTLRVSGKKNPVSGGITISADAIEYQR